MPLAVLEGLCDGWGDTRTSTRDRAGISPALMRDLHGFSLHSQLALSLFVLHFCLLCNQGARPQ